MVNAMPGSRSTSRPRMRQNSRSSAITVTPSGLVSEGGVALRPAEIEKHRQADDRAAGPEHAEGQAGEPAAEEDACHSRARG